MNNITILWLDDMRDPLKYFNKKSSSGAFIRNSEYYNSNIFGRYNPNFIWVKNFEEFTNYIKNNNLPDMVSFDRDLKNGNNIPSGNNYPDGEDCAKWLVEYCKQTNQKIPKYFVHSANPNGQREINNILNSNTVQITEGQLVKIIKESIMCYLNGK